MKTSLINEGMFDSEWIWAARTKLNSPIKTSKLSGKKQMRSEALSPGELYSLPDGEQGIYIYMRVFMNGGTPKWMVYSGKPY